MRHVSNSAIQRVMTQFQRMFMVDQEPLEILPMTEIADFIPQRRNPALRYVREWVVHPFKRATGIEGKPLRSLFKAK